MIFRKAILIIHGFAGGPWDEEELANNLQLYLDFDVYTFTLPGHDKHHMHKIKKEDWEISVDLQMNKLINRGYRNIYVIGHSMGGVLASYAATKYKEVRKLVLIAPAFKYLAQKNEKLSITESIKSLKDIFSDYSQEEVFSRLSKVPLPTVLEFMNLTKKHYLDPKLIYAPTLIIQGTNDKVVPIESSKHVYNTLSSKTVTLVLMKDVTHDAIRGNRTNEVQKLIIKFLRTKPLFAKKEIINL